MSVLPVKDDERKKLVTVSQLMVVSDVTCGEAGRLCRNVGVHFVQAHNYHPIDATRLSASILADALRLAADSLEEEMLAIINEDR
jgi:hypothetical protein